MEEGLHQVERKSSENTWSGGVQAAASSVDFSTCMGLHSPFLLPQNLEKGQEGKVGWGLVPGSVTQCPHHQGHAWPVLSSNTETTLSTNTAAAFHSNQAFISEPPSPPQQWSRDQRWDSSLSFLGPLPSLETSRATCRQGHPHWVTPGGPRARSLGKEVGRKAGKETGYQKPAQFFL